MLFRSGYGRVGVLQPCLSLQELLEKIKSCLKPPKLIFSPTPDLNMSVEKIAVLGGSGAGFIQSVSKTGATVYLTSDCKFHQFQESRDAGIILVDAGHYATERPACEALAAKFDSLNLDFVKLSVQDEDFRQFHSSF